MGIPAEKIEQIEKNYKDFIERMGKKHIKEDIKKRSNGIGNIKPCL